MPKHNPTDDVMSREAAQTHVANLLADHRGMDIETAHECAATIVDAFPFVETNRERTNVPGGQKVHLKRLVLTGEWQVDPNGAGKDRGED
jgi:hypothetical protein